MTKKIFIYLFTSLLLATSVFAEDDWNDFGNIDRAWDGQKSITNKEFEEAINVLEGKKKEKEEKQNKRKIKKISGGGNSLHSELGVGEEIKKLSDITKNEEGLLLNIPVNLIIDETPLEKGYYKVFAEKDKNNDIYFKFYQSQFFKGQVRASVTDNDYNKETIDFIELIPYDDNFVKIIFGSLDFNAYAYVRYQSNI